MKFIKKIYYKPEDLKKDCIIYCRSKEEVEILFNLFEQLNMYWQSGEKIKSFEGRDYSDSHFFQNDMDDVGFYSPNYTLQIVKYFLEEHCKDKDYYFIPVSSIR